MRAARLSFVFSAIYAGWAGALYGGYLMYIVPSSFNLAKSCELITTTVEDCARQGCRYFHIVADDLDALLDKELNHRA